MQALTKFSILKSLFLLSVCTDELISTPEITTFLLQSKFGIEKSERESNPIQYSE